VQELNDVMYREALNFRVIAKRKRKGLKGAWMRQIEGIKQYIVEKNHTQKKWKRGSNYDTCNGRAKIF